MIVTVPCYNEEQRLAPDRFAALAAEGDLGLLFVDDGSTDGTPAVLDRLVRDLAGRGACLRLATNLGKGEAVRRGMLAALERGASVVGYLDADLATPGDQVVRLLRKMDSRDVAVVLGARVALLGARIERSAARHYLGRLFATAASVVLGIPVYDTQCGAKLFRASPLLRDVLARPFRSRWAFDVELIDRLLTGSPSCPPLAVDDLVEVPLARWSGAGGSKMRPGAMLRAGLDVLRLGLRAPGIRGRRAARRRA